MTITLKRSSYTAQGVFGYLYNDCMDQIAVCLEHAYQTPPSSFWGPKIPAGVYKCIRRLSPKFGYDVFILLNVPGHDFVEIHRGNWEENSDGCILLGTAIVGSMITDSKVAFTRFMDLLAGQNEFTLIVK